MFQSREYQIPAKNVRSLQWHNQQLFDWVAGGHRYHLDGQCDQRNVNYAYRFDAAIVSPSGDYVVLYERLGTKGLLLHQGRILRELNRSFYHAHVYEYPVAFLQLADGREVLVHCPKEYCRLEFEDIVTGQRLTARDEHRPADIFFSRLASSPPHRFLLMAGWVWQPWDVIGVYDVQHALDNPTILDGYGEAPHTGAEIYAASFSDAQTLVLVTSNESFDDDDENDPLCSSGPQSIAYYDLASHKFLSMVSAKEIVGTIMPIDSRYIVGFYEHPKLFDCLTGEVVHRWQNLATGKQTSSIQWHIDKVPPYAIDNLSGRFAVANGDTITVIEIKLDD